MRLFFALWPPREAAQVLAQWASEVARISGGRATPEDKIHLTLAFLGGVDPQKAVTAAKPVRSARFDFPVETAKYWRDNHIVWVGPREMPEGLQALVERLQLALYRAEFILERRPFAAHVTLVRKARAPKALPPLPKLDWPVREFALVNSDQGRYKDVERFALDPVGGEH